MSTDWRALCAELVSALADFTPFSNQEANALANARAALSQPVPEVVGPTDEELLALVPQGSESDFYLPQGLPSDWIDGDFIAPPEAVLAFARAVLARWGRAGLADGPAVPEGREPASVACEPSDGDLLQLMPEQFRADLGTVSRMAAHGAGPDIKPGLFRVSLNTGALEYARAVLARYGRPAPAPAKERQAAPVPVAVSERLPKAGDCDAEGRCWFLRFPFDYSRESWSLEDRTYGCNTGFTHWLPAHALPLPSGEVE